MPAIAPGVVCRMPCFRAIISVFGLDWMPFINSLAAVGPRIIATKTSQSSSAKFRKIVINHATHPHKNWIKEGSFEVV